MKHKVGIATTALVVLLATRVAADPTPAEPLHLKTPSSVQTDGGTSLRLPPGYFLEEPVWNQLDAELKRLQERETRLDAENKSLRASAKEVSFGWYVLGGVAVACFAGGVIYAKM